MNAPIFTPDGTWLRYSDDSWVWIEGWTEEDEAHYQETLAKYQGVELRPRGGISIMDSHQEQESIRRRKPKWLREKKRHTTRKQTTQPSRHEIHRLAWWKALRSARGD